MWCGVVWCAVVCCAVVWCGVVWSGRWGVGISLCIVDEWVDELADFSATPVEVSN